MYTSLDLNDIQTECTTKVYVNTASKEYKDENNTKEK